MLKSPNYIHFRVQWQLLGPEAPGQRFEKRLFQDFWATLGKDPVVGEYDDFSYRVDRCELASARPSHREDVKAFSKVLYTNDQLTVVEEWAEISASEFGKKLVSILNAWFRHFPNTCAITERCWLRALVAPVHSKDSRQFIGNRILALGGKLQSSLAEMPNRVGFTIGCERSHEGRRMGIDTKVNSWRDNQSVWIEVSGAAPLTPPINAAQTERARTLFATCKDFLEREVIGLLESSDSKPEAEAKGEDK